MTEEKNRATPKVLGEQTPDFGKAIEKLNKQPKEFWLKYAGQTLYVRFSEDDLIVLYNNADFSAVSEYAEKHATEHRGSYTMIVPVPSEEQLNRKFSSSERERGIELPPPYRHKKDKPRLAFVDSDQHLPENPYPKSIFPLSLAEVGRILKAANLKVPVDAISGPLMRFAYLKAQEEMLEKGWRKVSEFEEEEEKP